VDVTTARLRIRDFVEDDLSSVIAWRTDPDVMRYMEVIEEPTENGAREFLASCIEYNAHDPREAHNCAIVLRSTDEPIGWIGIGPAASEKAHIGDLDFGYALQQAHWGHGYAPEALRAVLDYALTEMNARTIFGACETANIRSARVMTRVGMTHTGKTPWDEGSELFVICR
jgi:ribosomal-protein-alanine N-acetyltransferase